MVAVVTDVTIVASATRVTNIYMGAVVTTVTIDFLFVMSTCVTKVTNVLMVTFATVFIKVFFTVITRSCQRCYAQRRYRLPLGAFAKSREAPISFVTSACLCVCVYMYQLSSRCTDFRETGYWRLIKIRKENPNLVKIGQKYRALCMKT
jgi:hypothetical protein